MKERYLGIVLAASTIGEYDKRVVLLTKEGGRFSAFAKGARRPKSPLSAVTEPFCFGEYYVFCGRDSYSIEEVRIHNFFPELRRDLDKLYLGMYFCEVADYFTREGMSAGDELELLYRSLLALSVPDIPTELTRRIYELRMLAVSGYAPYYDKKISAWREGERTWNISDSTSYAIGQILTRPIKNLYQFTVSEAVLSELSRCIGTFFEKNVDRKFRSIELL